MSTAPLLQDQSEETPQLSNEARTALEGLFTSTLTDGKSSRRSEIRKTAEQRFMRNGYQHLRWDDTAGVFQLPEASGLALPRFMDVYNIYTPHWRSFVSILSQNPPGINFVADDLQRSVDVTAASYAEKMRHRVDRLVNMDDRQAEVAGFFCTDGRTITWSRIDANGKLRCTVHGVLESRVPIFERRMERWGYCILSEEVDKYEAQDEYPDFADDIDRSEDTADSNYERMARLGVLANRKGGGIGSAGKHLVTEHNGWFRPSRFRKVAKELQPELKALFPDGVLMTMLNGKVVKAIPQKMEDALVVQWPAPGQGQNRPSLLHDLVPIQKAFNDALNMLREHFEFSIPATWITDTVDSEAISEQRSAPGVIHQITVPAGASIEDLVFQEQAAQLPPELVANIDRLLSLAQFTTGDLPSLYGDGTPDQETATGQKMLSDQAKGQLSPAWSGLKWLFSGTYEIGVKLAATMVADRPSIAISGGSGQQKFNPAAILDGVFGCYPDKDSAFPETTADQRASFQSFMTQIAGAQGGEAIVMHPNNLRLAKKYTGLKDLTIQQADSWDKQIEEIEQMLNEPPIPDQAQIPTWQQTAQQALMAGQQAPPMPLTSSVPIAKRDFHQYEMDACAWWLSSRFCLEEKKKGNLQGIENINLHMDLHEAALAAAAPKPQVKPPNVTLTAQIQDPNAIAQLLGEAGAQTSPQEVSDSQVPEQQEMAAKTQHSAAQAQHQSVLAAKEAVTPITRPPNPDQVGLKEK